VRGIKKRAVAAVAALSAVAALAAAAPAAGSPAAQSAAGLTGYGISSDGTLMAMFSTDQPTVLNWVRVVTGLKGDTALLGIDHRIQDGTMYGLGDQGGIYTISTPPQTPDVVVTKVSQLQVPLYGKNFGFDFNPAADRVRVVSDNGQNLRHNLNDHTTVEDLVLTTPPNGTTRGVTASGYTNNDLNNQTATTLFGINTTTDQVVIQSPANNGTLAPTGSLGFDVGPNAGLDVYADLVNGKTKTNTAFASLQPAAGGAYSLYDVNLLTGETTSLGQFPLALSDIAIQLDSN
jgi:hypothetical protein